MTGNPYNGYSWQERAKILVAIAQGHAPADRLDPRPCALCGDLDRPADEWHSEDYSEPYSFQPPQTWPLCKPCHSRLHKRFKEPAEAWELFCRHVEAGGTAREFSAIALPRRLAAMAALARGEAVGLDTIRPFTERPRWWRELTLDPESLIAPWARPRPLRPRPDIEAYRAAIALVAPTEREMALLRYHARAPRRTITMRQAGRDVLNGSWRTANLVYGGFAKRIGRHIDFEPDNDQRTGPFWMSCLAEGWWPDGPNGAREFELVLIPQLVTLFG